MKIYKSSDLTHKRAEVMREAEKSGVIIQECRTNGEVVWEFVFCTKDKYMGINGVDEIIKKCNDPSERHVLKL